MFFKVCADVVEGQTNTPSRTMHALLLDLCCFLSVLDLFFDGMQMHKVNSPPPLPMGTLMFDAGWALPAVQARMIPALAGGGWLCCLLFFQLGRASGCVVVVIECVKRQMLRKELWRR